MLLQDGHPLPLFPGYSRLLFSLSKEFGKNIHGVSSFPCYSFTANVIKWGRMGIIISQDPERPEESLWLIELPSHLPPCLKFHYY